MSSISLRVAMAGFLALLLGGCAKQTAQTPEYAALPAPAPTGVERLANFMAGSFSSAEQAKADPEFRPILLHMKRIWRDRTDGPWLYVEQAVAQAPNQPYRQRIYRLVDLADGRFRSDVYTLPGDPLRFAGEWKRPIPLPDVNPEALTLRDGCSLILSLQPNGDYTGSTNAQDCPSDLRGASYATSEAVISGDRMISWDRGYDKDHQQVWGAVKAGYIFKKSLPW